MAIHRDRRYDSDIMCQQLQRTSEDIGEKRMTEYEDGCRLIALLRADIGNYEKNRRIYARMPDHNSIQFAHPQDIDRGSQ